MDASVNNNALARRWALKKNTGDDALSSIENVVMHGL
jgi:hypothetical protein